MEVFLYVCSFCLYVSNLIKACVMIIIYEEFFNKIATAHVRLNTLFVLIGQYYVSSDMSKLTLYTQCLFLNVKLFAGDFLLFIFFFFIVFFFFI